MTTLKLKQSAIWLALASFIGFLRNQGVRLLDSK